MKKNIKILLICILVLITLVALLAIGLAIYRTTPHYTLRHEHYADVTLDDGTVLRFIRRLNKEKFGMLDEVDLRSVDNFSSDSLVIPSYVGGFPVTGIGTYAAAPVFPDDVKIKSLTLPDTVTEIFYLKNGTLTGLESLHIGKATSDIPWIDYNMLQEITVHPDNARYRVESGCLIDKNTNAVVFSTINSVIPEGITGIDSWAFFRQSIQSLSIPSSLQSIGDYALADTAITELTLPEGLTSLGKGALAGADIQELVIPDGVSAIPGYLLSDCTELETLTIGKGVAEIDTSAFFRCKKLREIMIDSENPTYYVDGTSLLEKGSNRLVFYFAGEPISEKAHSIGAWSISANKAEISKVILPNSIEKIETDAIYGSGDFICDISVPLYIFIPDNVTTVESGAIYLYAGAIYCEAAEKPAGWDEKWTRSDFPVYWGCTLEEFTALETEQ